MYLVFRKGIGGYYVKEMQPGMNKIALTVSNENVLLNENRSKDTSSSFLISSSVWMSCLYCRLQELSKYCTYKLDNGGMLQQPLLRI